MKFTRITVNSKQMGGVPCIRGLRIPVATIVGMIADGMTEEEILQPVGWGEARTPTFNGGGGYVGVPSSPQPTVR